jgi:methyl-accepting chemotaxis protein
VQKTLLALALVTAFQAGRLMATEGGNSPVPGVASAYAQVADVCSQFDDPASAEATECRYFEALIDSVALASLERLGIRIAERAEVLQPQLRPALESAVELRLGDEIDQVRAQAADTAALMNRTTETLARSRDLLARTRELLDETDETLDDSKSLLEDSEELLEDTEDLLERTEDLLDRGEALAERLQDDIDEIKEIIDQIQNLLPGQP